MKRIEILVSSTPDNPEFGWGDHCVVYEDDVVIGGCHCSTCPNPYAASNPNISYQQRYGWIALGTYRFLFIYHPSFSHCLLINEGGAVESRYKNPNKGSKYYGKNLMNEIFIHKGAINSINQKWRGSAGCITIPPDSWPEFISLFHPGDKGELVIKEFITNKENPVADKKSPLKSKTLWFNVLALAVTVGIKAVEKMSGTDVMPTEVATAIVAVGNFLLRFITDKKIG